MNVCVGGLGESGCRKTHHCDGGALCIHGRCECPSGYKAHYNKCIKQGGKLLIVLVGQTEARMVIKRVVCLIGKKLVFEPLTL